MLRLKEIKINNGIISAKYDPESSGLLGRIAINIENGEVVTADTSEYEDGPFQSYKQHAIRALKRIMNEKTIPSEKLVMWY